MSHFPQNRTSHKCSSLCLDDTAPLRTFSPRSFTTRFQSMTWCKKDVATSSLCISLSTTLWGNADLMGVWLVWYWWGIWESWMAEKCCGCKVRRFSYLKTNLLITDSNHSTVFQEGRFWICDNALDFFLFLGLNAKNVLKIKFILKSVDKRPLSKQWLNLDVFDLFFSDIGEMEQERDLIVSDILRDDTDFELIFLEKDVLFLERRPT